jgi:hypothetical protein
MLGQKTADSLLNQPDVEQRLESVQDKHQKIAASCAALDHLIHHGIARLTCRCDHLLLIAPIYRSPRKTVHLAFENVHRRDEKSHTCPSL